MGKGITGHMVVKNEDQFIWYAISSVLPYVDRLLITDTGSTDQTIPIIQSFGDTRIQLLSRPVKAAEDMRQVRQEQLEQTKTDWLWVVDGDEVYPKSLCEEIHSLVREGRHLEGIVVGRYDLLGDIYHYQSETVGTYDLFGKKGHIVIRLINKKHIPGLHLAGTYPYEGYYDQQQKEIIHHNRETFAFTTGKLWHAMYLKRSSHGARLSDTFHRKKWKIERGNAFPKQTVYPEVFFSHRPAIVPEVTAQRSPSYRLLAEVISPIKSLKRRIIG